MKATITTVSAMAAALVSFAAMAQQDGAQSGEQAAPQQDEQRFEEVKQRTEQRIQDRIADLQSRLTCVQNAQDPETLHACFPQRAGGNRGGGHRGGLKPQ
jgi:uncharacterized protein YlxW (UPF0749 family)